MEKGCESIKHGKSKNSTPLRHIINEDCLFKPIVFDPPEQPIEFNSLNRNESNKGSSPYHSNEIQAEDASDNTGNPRNG